jgi:hypothetical protein
MPIVTYLTAGWRANKLATHHLLLATSHTHVVTLQSLVNSALNAGIKKYDKYTPTKRKDGGTNKQSGMPIQYVMLHVNGTFV